MSESSVEEYDPVALETLKKWPVRDDVLLMYSTQHTCDLLMVTHRVPFSLSYSLEEVTLQISLSKSQLILRTEKLF